LPNRHSKSSFDSRQHIKAGASNYIEMLEFNPLENLLQTFVSICFKEYDCVCRYRIAVKGNLLRKTTYNERVFGAVHLQLEGSNVLQKYQIVTCGDRKGKVDSRYCPLSLTS
jgi:hypothetical protein